MRGLTWRGFPPAPPSAEHVGIPPRTRKFCGSNTQDSCVEHAGFGRPKRKSGEPSSTREVIGALVPKSTDAKAILAGARLSAIMASMSLTDSCSGTEVDHSSPRDDSLFHHRAAEVLDSASRASALCGLAAARLWGLPVPPSRYAMSEVEPIDLVTLEGLRCSRKSGSRGHELELPQSHLAEVRGLRATSPTRTWIDCAALIDPRHLVAMGDSLLRKELGSRGDLEQIVRWAARRRGVVLARRCLPVLSERAESAPESWLRWHIVDSGLPSPAVNQEIVVRGSRVLRLDLSYPLLRIGIEYDGDWHSGTLDHDRDRRALLRDEGWQLIVVHKEDLDSLDPVLGHIRECLASRRARHHRRW